ncbi:MAG: TetR/AcrR family transcriptional regulator [Firmicutes bacterium]|jgi:AraC-like DNA-binding protein|nr:TetR/AcrR family transcriptional regulator [Bacillota bacterium]
MKKSNKSIDYSRNLFVNALIKLSKHKSFNNISIKDLCDNAGVSRPTFYRNYKSKEDIFRAHLTNIYTISLEEISNLVKESNLYLPKVFFELHERELDFFETVFTFNMDHLITEEFTKCLNQYVDLLYSGNKNCKYNDLYKYSLYSSAGKAYIITRFWVDHRYISSYQMYRLFNSNYIIDSFEILEKDFELYVKD